MPTRTTSPDTPGSAAARSKLSISVRSEAGLRSSSDPKSAEGCSGMLPSSSANSTVFDPNPPAEPPPELARSASAITPTAAAPIAIAATEATRIQPVRFFIGIRSSPG